MNLLNVFKLIYINLVILEFMNLSLEERENYKSNLHQDLDEKFDDIIVKL
jgi:hypothetical protein